MTSKGMNVNKESSLRNAQQRVLIIFKLKMALYSNALVMKLFNNGRKLFYA